HLDEDVAGQRRGVPRAGPERPAPVPGVAVGGAYAEPERRGGDVPHAGVHAADVDRVRESGVPGADDDIARELGKMGTKGADHQGRWGMRSATEKRVNRITVLRSRVLAPRAAKGTAQATYHGMSHVTHASRATIAQPVF